MHNVEYLIDSGMLTEKEVIVKRGDKSLGCIPVQDLRMYGIKEVEPSTLHDVVWIPYSEDMDPYSIPWPEAWEDNWKHMSQVEMLAAVWEIENKELARYLNMSVSAISIAFKTIQYEKPSLQDRPLKWARAIVLIAREKYSPASPPIPPPVHTGEDLAAEIDAAPLPTRKSSSPMSIGDFIDMLKTPIGQLSFEEATKISAVLEMIDNARGR